MKRQKQTVLCETGVNPVRGHGVGCWGNRRVVWSVRIDEKLAKAAKPVLQHVFGSTCRGVEAWLAGLLATYQQRGLNGVYPNTTVRIENLNVQRNIRTRRRLVVDEVVEVRVSCGFCGRDAVWLFRNVESGKEQYACGFHGRSLDGHVKWVRVGEVEGG